MEALGNMQESFEWRRMALLGWHKEIIIAIKKKGGGGKREEYRGVTIIDTIYKVYANIATDRLVKEIEEEEVLKKGQIGYRDDRQHLRAELCYNQIYKRKEKKNGNIFYRPESSFRHDREKKVVRNYDEERDKLGTDRGNQGNI